MTLSLRIARLSLAVLFLAALPLHAQGKRRAVAHPGNAGGDIAISGTITDASTGAPIAGALITYGDRASNITGADGKFTINVPAGNAVLTADQFAYGQQAKTITAAPNVVVNFSLTPKSLATIKLKNGEVKKVVYDTAQFAYLIIFSGYIRSDQASLCKQDGQPFQPFKGEISRIFGPITEVTFAPCCEKAPVVTANFQMKSGATVVGYFADSCFGNEVVFMGRDPQTGAFTYVRWLDITEVTLP